MQQPFPMSSLLLAKWPCFCPRACHTCGGQDPWKSRPCFKAQLPGSTALGFAGRSRVRPLLGLGAALEPLREPQTFAAWGWGSKVLHVASHFAPPHQSQPTAHKCGRPWLPKVWGLATLVCSQAERRGSELGKGARLLRAPLEQKQQAASPGARWNADSPRPLARARQGGAGSGLTEQKCRARQRPLRGGGPVGWGWRGPGAPCRPKAGKRNSVSGPGAENKLA